MKLGKVLQGVFFILLSTCVSTKAQGFVKQVVQGDEIPAASYAPKVGEFHPDFLLPSIDRNEPVRLSDYRGKKVLLVHFASW